MTTPPFPHELGRAIVIKARRETVFRYFTDSARWAAWWGQGSTIDPRPGGKVIVCYPGGRAEVQGEVLELSAPERIVFTYGYVKGGTIPPGSSRVTIRLEEVPAGTRLHLSHEFAEVEVREQHLQGWRYQLAIFSQIVTGEVNAKASQLVRDWFAAWTSADPAQRRAKLEPIVTPGVRFADRFGLVEGLDELLIHVAAVHAFMPGTEIALTGEARQCHGSVLADWTTTGGNGAVAGRGTNVFVLDADGRIEQVTGFWPSAG
jgi:uncharacterized protein YndB with AHSA1/START domain